MPAGGLVILMRVLEDGDDWRRSRWRMSWHGGAPTQILDGSTSLLLNGVRVFVNRSTTLWFYLQSS